MTRVAVESSNVAALGFDAAAGLIEVEFRSRDGSAPRVYAYTPATLSDYTRILEAESIGVAVRQFAMTPGVNAEPVEEIQHAG